MWIVLFGGRSDSHRSSVAAAQEMLRSRTDVLAWFVGRDGAVHDVSPADVIAHAQPLEREYVPHRPAIFPDLEQALDTMPVDDPAVLLALDDPAAERLLEARGIPFTRER